NISQPEQEISQSKKISANWGRKSAKVKKYQPNHKSLFHSPQKNTRKVIFTLTFRVFLLQKNLVFTIKLRHNFH
ncbi:hypothetical protein, partial [Niallia circulans]|uniref:hypothetical protein n=1 Tax=Niallia circulans TaxID=1397 RepID=UPI0026F07206